MAVQVSEFTIRVLVFLVWIWIHPMYALGDLKMGSAHKDLATKMVEASKMDKASDTQIVKVDALNPLSSAHML